MWPDGRHAGRSIAERALPAKQGCVFCGSPGDLPPCNEATRHRTLVTDPSDAWRQTDHRVRRHGAPDNRTPSGFARPVGPAAPAVSRRGKHRHFGCRCEVGGMRREQVTCGLPPPSTETGRQTNRRQAVVPDDKASEAAGARTQDQRIKSPMLYRLSYSLGSHRTEAVGADNGPPSRTHRRRRGHAPRSARERT